MEREINEFRQTRERQLQEQALRMREGIVKEITDIVMERVKANNLDLVFDKSGMSLNGVPLVMYSRDNAEFTNDIVAALNKGGAAPAARCRSSRSDDAGSDEEAVSINKLPNENTRGVAACVFFAPARTKIIQPCVS